MHKLETGDLRGATLVANAWQQFESQILPAAVEDLTPADADLARLFGYFGAFALFGILGAVLDDADREAAVEVARSTLADEFHEFDGTHEADLH